MERFIDKNGKIAEIEIKVWDENRNQYGMAFESDLFEVGSLERDEEKGAYIVENVDYLVDYADDWKNMTGDFAEEKYDMDYDEIARTIENRTVDVNILDEALTVWVLVDQVRAGDMFDDILTVKTATEAVQKGVLAWERMSLYDQKLRSDFYVGLYGYDPDAGYDLDKEVESYDIRDMIAANKAMSIALDRNVNWDEVIETLNQGEALTINECRNGRKVAWYLDPDGCEACVEVDGLEELNKDDIERELM